MKKFIMAFVLAIPFLAWADQPVQKGERLDDATIVNETPVPQSFATTAEELIGEPVATVLVPEFQQLEDNYRIQINQLRAQIELAQQDQAETLELQVIALKQQLSEERLEVVLNYVRANGNKDAEARVLKAIDEFRNPVAVKRVAVERDPMTGAEKKGGSQ